MTIRRLTDDHGAVAVTVAIMALVLFGLGALAVDIGNLQFKRSQAQNSADFAALAGAGKLPDTTAALTEAVTYLQNNELGEWDTSTWTESQFTNGDTTDGEITFSGNTQITVVTPTANVSFGLANAFGESSGPVNAQATAAIYSPGRILPFFLPVDCALGQQVIKTGAQAAPEPTPVFDPGSANGNGKPDLDTSTSLEAPLDTTGTNGTQTVITIFGDKFANLANTNVYFTRGDVNIKVDLDTNTTQVTPPLTPPADVLDPLPDPSAAVNLGSGGDPDEINITVPDAVDTVSGIWYIRVENGAGISASQPISKTVQLTVDGGANLADQCGEKLTGDFGYLDSPRADDSGGPVTQAQGRLDLNIAFGLDHDVRLFDGTLPNITVQDNCRTTGNAPIPGGQLDQFATRDGANCLDIFNGNKVDASTDGLIKGGTVNGVTFDGRLDAPATPGCSYSSGSNPTTVLGVSINNDVLSCFVRSGYKVNDVISADPRALITDPTQVTNGLLTPEILDSPRFFVVPVIHFNVNPPNGFYPIVDFRGVFITDENPNAAPGASTATATNGLQSAAQKLSNITVQAFKLSALPDVVVDTDGGIPYLGSGPKLVRLIA